MRNMPNISNTRRFMNAKDPGRLDYRIHNIYLNFVETYGRLDPGKPITLAQKTLFSFWMTVIVLWLFIKLTHLLNNIRQYKNDVMNPLASGDSDADEQALIENDNYLSEGAFKATPSYMKMGERKGKMEDRQRSHNDTNDIDREDAPQSITANVFERFRCICFSQDKDQPPFEGFLLRMILFCSIMFYFWLCDHLRIWPKVEKQYSRDIFIFIYFLLVFVAFIFTIKKTQNKLLSRDQTEEWKGWMQVQFVWYHYWDAQEVYNSIRVYVGAYVWMTGFGNYMYFSSRQDYSIFRLLKMLFRLNFLVFCVMVVTDHTFVRYYICAMHTYWFLSVWACMVVMNRYNKYPSFMLGKFALYIGINAIIFNVPGVHEMAFTPFKWVLYDDKGTMTYWKYRSWLDHWSTIVGMMVAFNYGRYEQFIQYLDKNEPKTRKLREALRYGITIVLLALLCVWIHFIMCKDHKHYLKLHPFLSPVPIVIYTWLRNMHPVLRTYHLNLFTWLGKITLETYLSQIHIYMVHSAERILVYLPNYPMMNFALATIIYVGISYVLFHLTVFFSSYILPRDGDVVLKNLFLGFVWLLVCYVFAFILTHEHNWSCQHSGLEFLRWNITKH